ATAEDLSTIKGILYETAVWLSKKGSTQWAGLLKGEDVHNVQQAIEKKEVFLAYSHNEVIGTFALWDKQTKWDIDLWGLENHEDFYYLHRIAVDRTKKEGKKGYNLIEGAKEIARHNQKKGIRLDCIATNNQLNSFYNAHGFTFVKTIKDYDNGEGLQDYNLYQWEI
ncbi:MAG: GNAT family N-acetyltransferase, partial [Gammaproteobacteria bacterium]|nr:GNAT family N-acetyltransferase [Gammaproteobacteria bacterium]